MVEKNIDDNHDGSVTTYASDLIKKIKSGSYKSLTDDWLACSSTTETLSRRFFSGERYTIAHDVRRTLAGRASDATITPLECPLVWAQESNAYDCVRLPLPLPPPLPIPPPPLFARPFTR